MRLLSLSVAVEVVAACAFLTAACGPAPEAVTETRLSELPPAFYSSAAVSARVVDSQSGTPVEGAVVSAIWRKVDAFSGRWSGIFIVVETTTDASGAFTIHRWGPRPSPPDAVLDERDPELWVIKNGYVVGYFDNAGRTECLLPKDPDASPVWLKLPPGKTPNARVRDFARTGEGGSIWNQRRLLIRRASTPSELARSLSAANPRDPYLPPLHTPLPLFFAEWHASRAALGAREHVSDPPWSLLDVSIRTTTRAQ